MARATKSLKNPTPTPLPIKKKNCASWVHAWLSRISSKEHHEVFMHFQKQWKGSVLMLMSTGDLLGCRTSSSKAIVKHMYKICRENSTTTF
jgi:hypothetical protein